MSDGGSGDDSVVAAFQDWMTELEAESELKENIRQRVRDLEVRYLSISIFGTRFATIWAV